MKILQIFTTEGHLVELEFDKEIDRQQFLEWRNDGFIHKINNNGTAVAVPWSSIRLLMLVCRETHEGTGTKQ